MGDFGIDPNVGSDFVKKKQNRKKKASKSPTQLSLKLLRDRGYLPYISEYWCAFSKRRKDLYQFIDVVGLHTEGKGIIGVQTTTAQNINARIKKAENLESGAYWLWLSNGCDAEFHGWYKEGRVWKPKIVKVSYKDLFT